MDEMKATHIIRDLKKKWILHSILSDLLLAASITVLFFIIGNKIFAIPYAWSIPAFIILFAILTFVHSAWKIKETGIVQLLDQYYPSLEESSSLLIKPVSSLNTLETWQQQKTASALSEITAPLKISTKLKRPLLILVAALIVGLIIYKLPFSYQDNRVDNKHTAVEKKEKILPQVADVKISIKPPAYTARPEREQDEFNLNIEDGASVKWQLKTTEPVHSIRLTFNDSAVVSLQATDGSKQLWTSDKFIPAAGFYQLVIDSSLSDLYKIETIRDLAPVIHIQSPKQYTTIDYGEPEQVVARVDMTDDYAVSDAYITATIASGNGEAVKFKEQKISLTGFTGGRQEYHLQKLLSLRALGLQPGDEMYFYVKATDNHKQETRSDIYIINLPDTAQLMSLEGLANGINLKPEYFRSQRQIIIETEQLLRDKDTISTETFKNRSNNLGIDQKMLRLRYGKFLGEENESGVFEGENLNDLSDPSNFSNAEKLKDAFTDKHDNAEDATFLEPEVKNQLKATLTEMWNAELQLRTFKPKEALPFEYKALRLLKDLQQKSRVYVAKTNQKTTPLDLQKRLTGDLSKITSPALQKNIEVNDDPQLPVRTALQWLDQLRISRKTEGVPVDVMRLANIKLNDKAIQKPSVYLPSVQAMRKIMDGWKNGNIREEDIIAAENGLQKLLTEPELMPSAPATSSEQLSKQYFKNLQKQRP